MPSFLLLPLTPGLHASRHYTNLEAWNGKDMEGDNGTELDREEVIALFAWNKNMQGFWKEKKTLPVYKTALLLLATFFPPQKSSLQVVHELKIYFSRNRFLLLNSGIYASYIHPFTLSTQMTWSGLKSFIDNFSACFAGMFLFPWKH